MSVCVREIEIKEKKWGSGGENASPRETSKANASLRVNLQVEEDEEEIVPPSKKQTMRTQDKYDSDTKLHRNIVL